MIGLDSTEDDNDDLLDLSLDVPDAPPARRGPRFGGPSGGHAGLAPGGSMSGGALTSKSGSTRFMIQADGNLTLSHRGGQRPVWTSGTGNGAPKQVRLTMQSDSNLVLNAANGRPLWSTGTSGKGAGGAYLLVQDDGNLVVLDRNKKTLWASNTEFEKLRGRTAALARVHGDIMERDFDGPRSVVNRAGVAAGGGSAVALVATAILGAPVAVALTFGAMGAVLLFALRR